MYKHIIVSSLPINEFSPYITIRKMFLEIPVLVITLKRMPVQDTITKIISTFDFFVVNILHLSISVLFCTNVGTH